jgi:hypothetical protein
MPIFEVCVISGCGSEAIEAEEPDFGLAHRLAAGLATRHPAGFVVIHPIVPKLFSAFRADITVADFE